MPSRRHHLTFTLILTGVMTLIVADISVLRANGFGPDYVPLWISSWLFSWAIAFPTMAFAAPKVRKLTTQLVGA